MRATLHLSPVPFRSHIHLRNPAKQKSLESTMSASNWAPAFPFQKPQSTGNVHLKCLNLLWWCRSPEKWGVSSIPSWTLKLPLQQNSSSWSLCLVIPALCQSCIALSTLPLLHYSNTTPLKIHFLSLPHAGENIRQANIFRSEVFGDYALSPGLTILNFIILVIFILVVLILEPN